MALIPTPLSDVFALLIFPGGLFLLCCSLLYAWANRKLIAQLQSRIGPRLIQPAADTVKLLVKEEITPADAPPALFHALPILALAGVMTAALYVPLGGVSPAFSFEGDLIVTITLLSLLTLATGLAGTLSADRFSVAGATRALTQLFAYEAPFLLALLGPALATGSWSIDALNNNGWLLLSQPIGFVVAVLGLMGKLELHPFDAPEAETEIVAGALTEYSGRGLALFYLSRSMELVLGITLIATLFMGGVTTPLAFAFKTGILLALITIIEAAATRLRIDQTVSLWWKILAMLAVVQVGAIIGLGRF